jgi:DNA polymerase I
MLAMWSKRMLNKIGEWQPAWSISNYGCNLHIDNYDQMPTGSIATIDIETNGQEGDKCEIVCIGLTTDGINIYIYFDIRDVLISYLKHTQLVCHDGKSAEIPWLNRYGITIEQLYFDTKTGYYVYDSARKNYGLKPILKDVFNAEYPTYSEFIADKEILQKACDVNPELLVVKKKGQVLPKNLTLDKMPKELVAEYNGSDVFWTFQLWVWLRSHFTARHWSFFNNIEMPETRILYHMEQQGIKIDTKAVRRIHNENSKARRKNQRAIFELVGSRFNLNSPKQLLPILQSNGVDTDSTGEEVLIPFRDNPLVEQLLSYRKHQKICSTYTSPLYFSASKAVDSRIHAHFSQNTITGRLSSSDPVNLQNQPPDVRECFVAEEGKSFINADWSNIELRLPAHFSDEPGFINELSKLNGDLHTQTAIFIFGLDPSTCSEEEFKQKRRVAKTCNFLLTNSGTASRLASELQCSYEDAENVFIRFWRGYPVLAAWLKEEKRKARVAGGVGTWFGRWVNIPQLRLGCSDPQLCRSKFWKGRSCKNCIVREEAERSAMSILVQGSAADMCKQAKLKLFNEYGYVPNLAVHDELNYEIENDKVDVAKARIREVMENIVQLRVPLVADVKVGINWKDAH